MRITQVYISPTLAHFGGPFLKRYGLKPYYSDKLPAIFFGCYHGYRDYQKILRHKSTAIVNYGGTDVLWLFNNRQNPTVKAVINQFKSKPSIHHIASSKCNSDELNTMGIKHKFLPICPVVESDFKPCSLGDSVYIYSSHARGDFYGEGIVREVERNLISKGFKIPFIYTYSTPPGHYQLSEIPSVYAKCFIGMRLIKHDGISNTVIELGLMGRRCFWNETSPNAILWDSVSGITARLIEESKLIGAANNAVADATRNFINIGDSWLDTDYYENKTVKNTSIFGFNRRII